MIESLVVYSSLMIVMLFFGVISFKNYRASPHKEVNLFSFDFLIPIFCFAIIFGMRYDVGVDYLGYLNDFKIASHANHLKTEYLFRSVTYLFAQNGIHFSLYFSFWACLQILFIYLFFKDERYLIPFLVFVLFTGGYFLGWMNVIRQNIVFCIFIYSIKYIKLKKIFPYLLLIIIGFFIHKSAILLIIVYPLLYKERDYFRSRILQISIFLIALFFKGFSNWSEYLNRLDSITSLVGYKAYTTSFITQKIVEADSGLGFLIFILIDVIIIIYSSKLKETYKSTSFMIFYNLYYPGRILSLMFYGSIVLQRPILYFNSMKLIVVSYLLYYLWTHFRKNINSLFFSIIVSFYLMLFLALIYRGGSNAAEYKFFWQSL